MLYHNTRNPERERERQARAYGRQMQEGPFLLQHHGSNKIYATHLCPPCDPPSVSDGKLQIHYPPEFDAQLPECISNSRWHFERRLPNGPASNSHRCRQPLKSILRRRSPPRSITSPATNLLATLSNRVAGATVSSLASGSESPQAVASSSGASIPIVPSFSVVAGVKRKRGSSFGEDPEDNARRCPSPPSEPGPQVYYGQELPYTAGSTEDNRHAKVSFAEAPEEALAELAAQRAAADIAGPHKPAHGRSGMKKAKTRYSRHCEWMLRNDPEIAQLNLELTELIGRIVDCAETTFQQEMVSVMIEVVTQIGPRCPTYAGIQDDVYDRLVKSEEVKMRLEQLRDHHLTLQQASRSQTGEPCDRPPLENQPPPPVLSNEAQSMSEEERRVVAASMPQSSAVWRYKESDPVAGPIPEASSLLWSANRPRRTPTPTQGDANTEEESDPVAGPSSEVSSLLWNANKPRRAPTFTLGDNNTEDQVQSAIASPREVAPNDSHLPSTGKARPKRGAAPLKSQRDTQPLLGSNGLTSQPASEGSPPPLRATRLPQKARKRACEADSAEMPPRTRPRTRSQTAPERGLPERAAPLQSPQTHAKPKGKKRRAAEKVSDAGPSHSTRSKSRRK